MGNPDEIPVVDLSAFSNGDAAGKRSAAKALGDAARGLGFMVVGGHGIDPLLGRDNPIKSPEAV